MSRLLATMGCDVRLQWRNGFYYAVFFLVAVWAVLLTQLPRFDWAFALPPLVLGNLVVATYLFMGGLVLLEKGEGTLEAQVVTPLTTSEYLISKVLTLTALSLAENVVIVWLAQGADFNVAVLTLGIVLTSALYCLIGFAVVARYDSINEYLFPSMVYVTLFSAPIVDYLGIWRGWWFYLHPFQGPLVILKGAFFPLQGWEWAYGVLYSVLWIVLAFEWSRRAFGRFVIASAGVR